MLGEENSENNKLKETEDDYSVIAFLINSDGRPDCNWKIRSTRDELALLSLMNLTSENLKNKINNDLRGRLSLSV